MVINTNIPSAYASRVLSNSTNSLAKALAKLSSGSRIVSPEDDAAGLAQSMKFSAEIGRIGAAKSNVGNAISFSQTQDGFMGKIDSALRRMSELATLSADQTKSNDDVANYQKEFAELKSFITKTSTKTFNTVGLFSSTTLADKDLNVDGDTSDADDALIKTQLDTTLKNAYDAWVADPGQVANAANITGATAAAATEVWTLAGHGLENGEKVTFRTATANGMTLDQASYVGDVSGNTFKLYTDAALTTVRDVTGDIASAAGIFDKGGDYALLKTLRQEVANMAKEWKQYTDSSTTETAYKDQTWATSYDYWATKTGNTWTGIRAHNDAKEAGTEADTEVHVGNAAALSDSLIENYKKMYADIRSYINNNGAGLNVTDSSDATTFQLKGADVSTITDAIASATDTNSLSAALTKTNADTYVGRISTLIGNLAGSRAYVGANISRLNMVESQLAVYGENLAAANSRIADVDVASESANYAKQQILVQSGTAMLAQANLLSQSALRLLQ
jgi:flagellin